MCRVAWLLLWVRLLPFVLAEAVACPVTGRGWDWFTGVQHCLSAVFWPSGANMKMGLLIWYAVIPEYFLFHWFFTAYLEEIQSVRRHTNSTSEPKSPNPPLLVHCSAGVGRTGVVILSEVMIACLEHNEVMTFVLSLPFLVWAVIGWE
jgi:protein-tyrosine phosphatase